MKVSGKNLTMLIVLSAALSVMTLFQNCSNNFAPELGADGVSGYGFEGQKPDVNCKMVSETPGRTVEHVISTSHNIYSSERFNEADRILLDCQNSSDNEDVNTALRFELDTDYQSENENFQAMNGDNINLNNMDPGMYRMAIRITDTSGQSELKTFNLIVECNDNIKAPSMSNASSAVSVSNGSKVGLYNYSINTSSLANGNTFEYAFDFNGDGVFDPYSRATKGSANVWSPTSSLTDIYSSMEGTRKINFKVRNECFKETAFVSTTTFNPNHPVARTAQAPAQDLGYKYLQADLVNRSSSEDTIQNERRSGDFLATDATGAYRFKCSGKPEDLTSLTIDTAKRYNSLAEGQNSMSISIANINDNGGTALQSVSGAYLNRINYTASGEPDGRLQQDSYSRTTGAGNCPVTMRIERTIAMGTCAAGKTGTEKATVVKVYGEFNCPGLMNSNGASLDAVNGKFNCRISNATGCVGGGGAGGNEPPQY